MSSPLHINKAAPNSSQFFPASEPEIGRPFPETTHPQNKVLPRLFTPLNLRGMEFKNRIWVSPMCQYSSDNGHATDWHLIHIGSLAVRGVGAIIMEATAVTPEGRISPEDAGLWMDSQIQPLKRIVDFCHANGTKIGIQLAHAGRKASTLAPWLRSNFAKPMAGERNVATEAENGWPEKVSGPCDAPFADGYAIPKAMTIAELQQVKDAFVQATKRCKQAGFDFLELHGAHGYLLSSFCSPLTNTRDDEYGGSLENRIRFPLEVAEAVRQEWTDKPLLMRIGACDWAEGEERRLDSWCQWGIEQSIIFAKALRDLGVDMIDCSSGGNWSMQKIAIGPGYQVPFAARIKSAFPELIVGAVGQITSPRQAESYLAEGKADVVFLARELLRRPDFALVAARELRAAVKPANQYERAWVDIQDPKLET